MKNLPIGIQAFEKIIIGDYLYVDKTKQIHDLITTGTTYFLSRPRRFGKSLLCSTLEEIFKGNKELFKGLWIYQSDYNWKPHPVIRIDMSKISHKTPEELEISLIWKIETIAKEHNINVKKAPTIQAKFEQLVTELSKKNKVVIIIDEYDKPIIDHITNIKVANQMRNILRDFYTQFKAQDEFLRFIFITGISKFPKTSIFSCLNNLKDLTFSRKSPTLLGYTQKELEFYFDEKIKKLSRENQTSKNQIIIKLKRWYNGYSFLNGKQRVYNPYSVLLVMDELRFRNFWFETGTPTFLIQLIKQIGFDASSPKSFRAVERELLNFEIEKISVKTLLYQTGYLTIDYYDSDSEIYYLDFPNTEVKKSLIDIILESTTEVEPTETNDLLQKLSTTLKQNNLDNFLDALKCYFAQIPYSIQNKNERYYQSIFYFIMSLLGFKIDVEVQTNIGRIDAVITTQKKIYIIEFKVDQNAQKAIKQMIEKKYAQKYGLSKKQIILVGINFDTKQKNISDFAVKEIN